MDGNIVQRKYKDQAKTDFCIAGFPKCGTSALARLLAESPRLNLATPSESAEAPVFMPGASIPPISYVADRPNGHKFAAYVYNRVALERIYAQNPRALFIFSVRPTAEALVSWRDMHRRIATAGVMSHFTTRDDETRSFYATCDLNAYYRAFAEPLLDYAGYLRRFMSGLPQARFVIITQKKLSTNPAVVMARIHKLLGRRAPANYLANLPAAPQPTASRDAADAGAPPEILNALRERDADLRDLLAGLDPSCVLISESASV